MLERSAPSGSSVRPALSKLLVVDDDLDHRESLSHRLIRHGYNVEMAENGPEALEKINQAHYDLVLLDQMMPGMSGLDLLRLLRATHSQSELPVIMVTAGGGSQSVVDALDQGANDHVSKPIDLPVVAARIRAQLDRSRADRDMQALDPLTGLCNRHHFLARLSETLARQQRRASWKVTVLLINLDGFKVLNNSLGYATGDRILIEVARRFEAALADAAAAFGEHGAAGTPVLARVGGDEFAVLFGSLAQAQRAEAIGHKLLACLAAPIEFPEAGTAMPAASGSGIRLNASLGIAARSRGKTTAAELLHDAGLALLRAKERGPNPGENRCEIFDPAMGLRARTDMTLAMDLRHAIERGQLVVFYQPKIHLATRAVIGFEALLRWRHPQCGLIPPANFIPLAEETGLIISLGSWVLRQACIQLKSWQAKFARHPALSMNVNLSVKQLADPGLVSDVKRILTETCIPPESLKLELTESSLVSQIESARNVLSQLQALQIGLKLDDFGTGYSSLNYLSTLHFDSLKIDRSFVNRLDSDPESRAVVEAILNLARSLHMTVVAEGIENEQQLARLIDLGCDTGQGFLFSKPVPAELAEALLTSAHAETMHAP
jgi:diguanylate cyclase (GGDEF)-like protein